MKINNFNVTMKYEGIRKNPTSDAAKERYLVTIENENKKKARFHVFYNGLSLDDTKNISILNSVFWYIVTWSRDVNRSFEEFWKNYCPDATCESAYNDYKFFRKYLKEFKKISKI